MNVYVIMGNDYPEAVFNNKDEAEAYVTLRRGLDEAEARLRAPWMTKYIPRIYWRVYEFPLRSQAVEQETV